MIKRLAFAAYELDEWLHQHAGRAYIAILSWGLVASILGSLRILGHAMSKGSGGLATLLALLFQAALLVNQLAQWHELRERRRRTKATQQQFSTGAAHEMVQPGANVEIEMKTDEHS
jgi:hypothetical protein